jgi:hypothetical protein
MSIFTIASVLDWNTVAENAPFGSSDVINVTSDLTFTNVPTVLPVGSATFNGGLKTITINFTEFSTGICSLSGGSISNLNINIVQWAGQSVLLCNSDAHGVVTNINYTGTINNDTTLLINQCDCQNQVLSVSNIDIDITVSVATNILWNMHLSGTLNISNITLAINGVSMQHPDNTRFHL